MKNPLFHDDTGLPGRALPQEAGLSSGCAAQDIRLRRLIAGRNGLNVDAVPQVHETIRNKK
jgi:hypothetical protein